MIYHIERLVGQVELLKKLSRHPAGVGWVHEAIKDATTEIERAAADDIAADYAREIRFALDRLHASADPAPQIAGSKVGEKILALDQYAQVLQQQYLPEEKHHLLP